MSNTSKIIQRLKHDFEFYAKHNLKIADKNGDLKPLILNKSQQYLHKIVEQQKKDTGKVRIIILKGRQQGCSTYIAGRIFHLITQSYGKQAFVLTHKQDATENLFKMSLRYLKHSSKFITPPTLQETQKTIAFDKVMSSYKIGTAGDKDAGRSMTLHFVHGSECAFWPSSSAIGSGLLQAVPFLDNTEIFLESTSYGIGNFFHTQWQLAESGKSLFKPVFIPWFWQDEYAMKLDNDFRATPEEVDIHNTFGISYESLKWRRFKIAELSNDGTDGVWQFKREYPNSALEAFEVKNTSKLIKFEHVQKAVDYKVNYNNGEDIIMGVDVARFGDDDSCIIIRKGSEMLYLKRYSKRSITEMVGIVSNLLDKNKNISQVYVDEGGLGAGVVDGLKNRYNHVFGVNFGSKANDNKYFNKRAEMWGNMRKWFTKDVSIFDDKLLIKELTCVNYTFHNENQIKLEKKEDIKKREGFSPDSADALALTFADSYYNFTSVQFSDILSSINV